MNSQGVAYQVRASEAPGKSIVRGWPIKFVHQRPPVNECSNRQILPGISIMKPLTQSLVLYEDGFL